MYTIYGTQWYIFICENITVQVVVIGHHPVGGSCIVRASRWWEELMAEYGDVVALHVSGHTHNDHFRLVSVLVHTYTFS